MYVSLVSTIGLIFKINFSRDRVFLNLKEHYKRMNDKVVFLPFNFHFLKINTKKFIISKKFNYIKYKLFYFFKYFIWINNSYLLNFIFFNLKRVF